MSPRIEAPSERNAQALGELTGPDVELRDDDRRGPKLRQCGGTA